MNVEHKYIEGNKNAWVGRTVFILNKPEFKNQFPTDFTAYISRMIRYNLDFSGGVQKMNNKFIVLVDTILISIENKYL